MERGILPRIEPIALITDIQIYDNQKIAVLKGTYAYPSCP